MSAIFPVNEDPRWRIHDASPGQTVFVIPYGFQAAADIRVVKIAADGTRTELSQPADYTVAGAGNPGGGSYTLTVPAKSGEKYLNFGAAVASRTSSIVRHGRFSSVAIDEDLDRALIRDLEQQRDIDRSLKVEIGEDSLIVENIPEGHFWLAGPGGRMVDGGSAEDISQAQGYAAEAGGARDEAQEAEQAAKQAALGAGAEADRAQSYAAMLSADKIKFPTVAALIADEVMSYTTGAGLIEVGAGDIIEAGGYRYEVAASGAADEHLSTAGGVKLYVIPNESGAYLPEQFGAVADGVTNDAAAILKAIEAVPSSQVLSVAGGTLRMSPGKRYNCGKTSIAIRKQINLDASEATLLFDNDFRGVGLDIKRAANLITNPDFEDDLTGWVATVPGSTSVVVEAGANSKVLRLTRVDDGTTQPSVYQEHDVVAGKKYSFSADVKGDAAASNAVSVLVRFLDIDSNFIAGEDVSTRFAVTDDYKPVSVAFIAPAGAAKARCFVRAYPLSTYTYLYVQNVSLNISGNEAILYGQRLNLPRVVKQVSPSWAKRSVGIRLCNTRVTSVYVPRVSGFQSGLMFEADGTGVVEVEAEIGVLSANRKAWTTRKIAGGWVNENTFHGGKYEASSGGPGVVLLDLSNEDGTQYLNHNVFIRPTLETTLSNVKQIVCGGFENTFISPRIEGGSPGSVHFTDASSANLIVGIEIEYAGNIKDEGTRNLFQSFRGGFMSRPAGGRRSVLRAMNAYNSSQPAIGASRYYQQWRSGEAVTVGEYRSALYNGVYVATTSGTTGGTAPSGTGTGISDGGVTWDYYANVEEVEIGLTSNGRILWPLDKGSYLAVDRALTILRWVRDGQNSYVANFVTPPASATSPGVAGQIAEDNEYLYVCVGTNAWRRVALSSW